MTGYTELARRILKLEPLAAAQPLTVQYAANLIADFVEAQKREAQNVILTWYTATGPEAHERALEGLRNIARDLKDSPPPGSSVGAATRENAGELPRCLHGGALVDHSGVYLTPPCGCLMGEPGQPEGGGSIPEEVDADLLYLATLVRKGRAGGEAVNRLRVHASAQSRELEQARAVVEAAREFRVWFDNDDCIRFEDARARFYKAVDALRPAGGGG
jgi:hypothetical protein